MENIVHYLFTAALAVIGTLLTILARMVMQNFKRYDAHIEDAQSDGETLATMEQKLSSHIADDDKRAKVQDDHNKATSRTLNWMGDCLITLGAKLDVKLPSRPE